MHSRCCRTPFVTVTNLNPVEYMIEEIVLRVNKPMSHLPMIVVVDYCVTSNVILT